MKTQEVADLLLVDRRTVLIYKDLQDDPLPSIRLKGLLRFRREAVMEWLARREND